MRANAITFIIGAGVAGAMGGCGVPTLAGAGGDRDAEEPGPPDLASTDFAMGVACGEITCAVGQICELGACHADCGNLVRCGAGMTETCCAVGDVCYLGACTTPGMVCGGNGMCGTSSCPEGQYCEPSINKCLPLAKTGMCEYHPPVGAFSPRVKWEWTGSKVAPGYNQVMMTPMVADLDGDCMPDVVFSTFAGGNYGGDGVLRAVRGDGKGELWNVTDGALRTIPGAQIALADANRDGKLEVFACHASGAVMALDSDGTKRWISAERPCSWDAPLVADVDHDGTAEVVVAFHVFNALTG